MLTVILDLQCHCQKPWEAEDTKIFPQMGKNKFLRKKKKQQPSNVIEQTKFTSNHENLELR